MFGFMSLKGLIKMPCKYCSDPESGECAYPYYGLAPHNSHLREDGTTVAIGNTTFLPKEQWPDNFTPDPDAPNCGTYEYCPECGDKL